MPKSGPSKAFRKLAGQAIFGVGETTYCGADVVLAAKAWRDWGRLEEEVRQEIACVKHARAIKADATGEEVEAAANSFREARGLFDAADGERWLAERHVTFDAWMKFIHRCLLRTKWESRLPELTAQYSVSQTRLNANIRVAGMCTGHIARFARKLAGRAAARGMIETLVAKSELESVGTSGDDAAWSFSLDKENAGLVDLIPEGFIERMRKLAVLERSFQQFRSRILVPAKVQAQINARHLDWIRMKMNSLSFPDPVKAREAALCAREDGEALAAVAARTKTPLRHENLYLEELEESLRAAFLVAQKGEVVGPLACGKEHKLFMVLDKVLPAAQDREVRARAEEIVVQKAIDSEVNARVRWLVPWWCD